MSSPADEAPNAAAVTARELRARVALRVGVLACVALATTLIPAARDPWPVTRALGLARGSGLVACGALFCALAVTPLSWAVRSASLGSSRAAVLRRALGMAAAWLALVHAVIAFVGVLGADARALAQTSHLIAGVTALCVLCVLLSTSYAGVVRVLRLRAWKELHRASYLAALLVVEHVALSAFAERRLVLALLGLTAALLGARLLAAIRLALRDRSRPA